MSVGRRTSYWKKAKEYATWASLLLASPVWACRWISQCSIFKIIKMACGMPFFGDGDSSPLLWSSNILQSSTKHPQSSAPCWIPRLEAHWLSPAALRSCGERDGRKERRSRGVPLHHLSVRGVVQRRATACNGVQRVQRWAPTKRGNQREPTAFRSQRDGEASTGNGNHLQPVVTYFWSWFCYEKHPMWYPKAMDPHPCRCCLNMSPWTKSLCWEWTVRGSEGFWICLQNWFLRLTCT